MMFIGNILAFTGQSIPSGYLVCDGSAVGREEYQELFAVIGTTYGAGDGISTFNLPSISGKTLLCTSSSHLIGSVGGEEEHSIVSSEMPSHAHTIPSHTHENTISIRTPSLSHTITQPVFTYVGLSGSTNRIRSGQAASTGTTSATMNLSTALAISDHPATPCTVTGGILDCPTFNTESTGGGVAHNNMMPYLAVTYLIKAGTPVPIEPGMAMYNGFMVATAGGGYITGKNA